MRRRRRAGKMAALRSDMPGDLEVYAEVSGAVQTNGLFDEFTSGAATRMTRSQPGMTRSSMLRAQGVRLNCYLNCEGVGVTVLGAPQGHGFIVKLPGQVDTIEEVLIHLQKQMKLDSRMLYASEMWTPDGKSIKTFKQLSDAAAIDSPIIVGCGEPFDGSRIPQDLLEFHKEGGGRQGARSVHKQLKTRRHAVLRNKAESVRQAGHGINSEAVSIARYQNVEVNKEHVNEMRHQYMESLLIRAAQQEDLMNSVKSNIEYHRMEAQESKARLEEKRAQRAEQLRADRAKQRSDYMDARREQLEKAQRQAAKVRDSTSSKKKGSKSTRAAKSSRAARNLEQQADALTLS